MSRTFKLLNASGKHVYFIQFKFKAILNVLYMQVSVYMCEYIVHANKMYMLYKCERINSTDINFLYIDSSIVSAFL